MVINQEVGPQQEAWRKKDEMKRVSMDSKSSRKSRIDVATMYT